jgi:tight adherence protein B
LRLLARIGRGPDPRFAVPGALRSLAALLRTGLSLRGALVVWPHEAPLELRELLLIPARRVRLGDSIEGALAALEDDLGFDARALQSIVGVGLTLGGDVPRMLDSLARTIEERLEGEKAAAASTAGAKLSGRIVAGLPLLCIPLLPASRAPLFDAAGIALLLAGCALAWSGLRWMAKLVPAPSSFDDGAAAAAEVVSSALRGGASLRAGLDAVARHPPPGLEAGLRRAAQVVRLGVAWAEALARSRHTCLVDLGRALRLAESKGVPAAAALSAFALARRAERARRLDAAIKRAPVLMVVPLVVCVLPAFMLLGLAPFIRGLGTG